MCWRTMIPGFARCCENGPGALDEASRLFQQIKPTLPVLLANLTTIGQIGVTYHPSIEQLLVLLPAAVAYEQTAGSANWPDGQSRGDFALTIDDPPICTVGFLPQSQWRSPADTTDIDTPDGLYCKLPQDSPLAVRGARNYPCMGHPGKRAPTVEICNSDKPFMPLAMRQHVLGPSPLDPNLLAQGIPPDDRVTADKTNLRPGRGNTAAAGGHPARNTRGAAGSNSTTGHDGRRRTAGAVVGGQHVDSGGGFSVDSATRRCAAACPAPAACAPEATGRDRRRPAAGGPKFVRRQDN